MKQPRLPTTPKELFKLPFLDWILFNGTIAFAKLTGIWKRPIRAFGDLERMRFIDKAYWLYKTTNPTRKARRNSGLEDYFAKQDLTRNGLPDGFTPQSELSVSAVGDLINHSFLVGSRDSVYAGISDLVFEADVRMANLECPIIPNAKKDFVFRFDAPPPLYYDLDNFSIVKGHRGKKFTFLATACNHSLDFGIEGLESTIQTLQKEGIAFSGINANEEDARKASIIEKNGFRIGVVAYTFGLNNYKPPKDRPSAVNVMKLNDGVAANDFSQFQAQIDFCKQQSVDCVIAHLHWGLEHEFYPVPEQVELAHHLAELGVDAIIGHHPHVIQPMELYKTRRDSNRVVPIYYSLGNLINYFKASYLCRSGVARFSLVKGRLPDGSQRTYIKDAEIREIVQKVDENAKQISLLRA